jgi:DEAD/DEAH box helicase domain-containing protein
MLASGEANDPVALLQAASRDHIPINPSRKSSLTSFSDNGEGASKMAVPDSKDRPSIDSVIQEIMEQEWYKEQIVNRRICDPKEGNVGMQYKQLA